jgi:DNA-binding transcriptional ArsR family regulator
MKEPVVVQAGFSPVAAALADPAREAIVGALIDGRALPAGELATIAGVSPQSASAHLQRLVDCGLLSVWIQGRFHYYRLAGDHAADVVEALANFVRTVPASRPQRRVPHELGFARCCYSHLAGSLGIDLVDRLRRLGYVRVDGDQATLTEPGRQWAIANGFIKPRRRPARSALRLCLDWTERRHHLAGPLATAILRHLLEQGHLRRGRGRALTLTPSGQSWFAALAAQPGPGVTNRKLDPSDGAAIFASRGKIP